VATHLTASGLAARSVNILLGTGSAVSGSACPGSHLTDEDRDKPWTRDSNCLEYQIRRGAPAYSEARMPELTDHRSRLPYSVSQPCDAGSMAHATVRACSECRRDDPRCPTVFEDLGTIGLSRPGCLKTYREPTLN
jgi:hypothetical protein